MDLVSWSTGKRPLTEVANTWNWLNAIAKSIHQRTNNHIPLRNICIINTCVFHYFSETTTTNYRFCKQYNNNFVLILVLSCAMVIIESCPIWWSYNKNQPLKDHNLKYNFQIKILLKPGHLSLSNNWNCNFSNSLLLKYIRLRKSCLKEI